MARRAAALAVVVLSGCGAVIEPGHRGLLFQPRSGGLSREVLSPGYHRVGLYGRIDDFDVTYSTKKEELRALSSEGLAVEVKLSAIYRPIIAELYELDVEIGPNYYDEVVGPELRTTVRGWMAGHSYAAFTVGGAKQVVQIEDEIEAEVRKRIRGKHVELSSVTLEGVQYAPEVAAAVRERLVAEQQLLRRKLEIEQEALRRKAEAEAESARRRLEIEVEKAKQQAEWEREKFELQKKAARLRIERGEERLP